MNIIKNILKASSIFVVIVIMLLALVLLLSKFDTPLQFRVFYVESGSMEPAIPTGSMVVVKSADSYSEGQVITVKVPTSPDVTVTHRVQEKIVNEETGVVMYRLKGDANEEPDRDLTNQNRVVGQVLFHLPYLGKLIAFSQSQLGFVLLIIMPATILAYNEVMTIKAEIQRLLTKKRQKSVSTTETPSVTS